MRSSVRAKGPWLFRYSRTRTATFSPMRGKNAICAADAWLMFTFPDGAASAAVSAERPAATNRNVAPRTAAGQRRRIFSLSLLAGRGPGWGAGELRVVVIACSLSVDAESSIGAGPIREKRNSVFVLIEFCDQAFSIGTS